MKYDDGTSKVQVYSQGGKMLFSSHSAQGMAGYVYLGDRLIADVSYLGTQFSHTDALGQPGGAHGGRPGGCQSDAVRAVWRDGRG